MCYSLGSVARFRERPEDTRVSLDMPVDREKATLNLVLAPNLWHPCGDQSLLIVLRRRWTGKESQ